MGILRRKFPSDCEDPDAERKGGAAVDCGPSAKIRGEVFSSSSHRTKGFGVKCRRFHLRARRKAMNPLVFRCPKSGQELDTGLDIHIHRASLRSIQPITLRVLCPLCGSMHVWKLADGWIREPRPAQRTGEWRSL
jgi:hypothetical protein